MKNITDVIFHDGATSTGDGTEVGTYAYNKLTIEISGTSATRTVNFKCKSFSGTAVDLSGVNITDLSNAVNTTGSGEIWQFDITGIHYVYINISAIAGGNVSVKGRLVAFD